MDALASLGLDSYIIPAAIAVVLLALLLMAIPDLRSRSGNQIKANGEIFGHVEHAEAKGTTYVPKVRFATGAGKTVEFVDAFGVANTAPVVGTPVTVVYPEANPEKARVVHPAKRFLAYAILAMFLAVLIAVYAGVMG